LPAGPCDEHAQLVAATATHSYHLQGEKVVLRKHSDVFPLHGFGRTSPAGEFLRMPARGRNRHRHRLRLLAILAACKGARRSRPPTPLPPRCAYHASLSPLQKFAINGGGPGGNAIPLDFLDVAPRQMHDTTRLYVIVNAIPTTAQRFGASRGVLCPPVRQGSTATQSFVGDNNGLFRGLMADGTVALSPDDAGGWQARQLIIQFGLKP
jgi:hypothetical protein